MSENQTTVSKVEVYTTSIKNAQHWEVEATKRANELKQRASDIVKSGSGGYESLSEVQRKNVLIFEGIATEIEMLIASKNLLIELYQKDVQRYKKAFERSKGLTAMDIAKEVMLSVELRYKEFLE